MLYFDLPSSQALLYQKVISKASVIVILRVIETPVNNIHTDIEIKDYEVYDNKVNQLKIAKNLTGM